VVEYENEETVRRLERGMATTSGILEDKRGEVLRIVARHGARRVRVFGSVVRGDAPLKGIFVGPDSDVDILVDLDPGRSLLDIVAIKQDLEDLLGCRVDVVTEAAISPYIRDRVLDEAVSL
jgi:predicted nucleotidyltransferase